MLGSYAPVFTTATSFGLGQSMLPTASVSVSTSASIDIDTDKDREYMQLREKILDPHRQDDKRCRSPPSPLAPVAALISPDSDSY